MQKRIRNKVLIIPYTTNNDILLVKDRETSEWGFISGGVKLKENAYIAACRELREETSSVLTKIDDVGFKRHAIYTTYREDKKYKNDKNKKILSHYTIFFFKIDKDKINLQQFTPNKEVTKICIDKLENMEKQWNFCKLINTELVSHILK